MRTQLVVYHLEMTDPSQLVPCRSACPPFTLARVEIPCPALNRFLYATVGGDWYWVDQLGWSYADWQRFVERDNLETWLAYVSGTPAGYFELELQERGDVQIRHFGLLPQFIGQGLGGALLVAAVRRAWARDACRVWLHTCSLDHPSALPAYLARGFRLYDEVRSEVDMPDRPVGPWPGAYD